jgi:hypothetical protein
VAGNGKRGAAQQGRPQGEEGKRWRRGARKARGNTLNASVGEELPRVRRPATCVQVAGRGGRWQGGGRVVRGGAAWAGRKRRVTHLTSVMPFRMVEVTPLPIRTAPTNSNTAAVTRGRAWRAGGPRGWCSASSGGRAGGTRLTKAGDPPRSARTCHEHGLLERERTCADRGAKHVSEVLGKRGGGGGKAGGRGRDRGQAGAAWPPRGCARGSQLPGNGVWRAPRASPRAPGGGGGAAGCFP